MGKLVVGAREYFTLEPAPVNPYHEGHPCIPAGRYQVKIERSPKFARRLPELQNVPGRTEILIHRGNGPQDTKGCILPGLFGSEWTIGQSTPAEERIIEALNASQEDHWITIESGYGQ